jgi:hypothetical protein
MTSCVLEEADVNKDPLVVVTEAPGPQVTSEHLLIGRVWGYS